MAVVLVRLDDHDTRLVDHEARIRPLERTATKLTVLGFVATFVATILANYLMK